MQKTQKIFFLFTFFWATMLLAVVSAKADDPRFNRVYEYAIMHACVEGKGGFNNTSKLLAAHGMKRNEKIVICACALAKTQEGPWWKDLDNDDVKEWINDPKERAKFHSAFRDNAKFFIEKKKCENY